MSNEPNFALNQPDAIRTYQFRTILRALKLEVDTGLKHSRNAAVKSAQNILKEAGKSAPRNKKELYEQFRLHLVSLGMTNAPTPASSPEKGSVDNV